jgi:UDP-N-acetylglucosamine diphosphorylase / glucose-1-phosphate thymidylyltransferase / UDP-N-acetylgalactosamine diphosphorylase / glucosamine-1-phosphate N-acetyltransferase / galactosamine-1-phosphate N-acetyltransferase
LRAWALLIRERWTQATGMQAAGFISSSHLAEFDEQAGISAASGTVRKGTVLVNARCAVSLAPAPAADIWTCGGKTAAVVLSRDTDVSEISVTALESLAAKNGKRVDVQGWWLEEVWDLINHLPAMLAPDIAALARPAHAAKGDGILRSGSHDVYVEPGAEVEKQVYFDCTAGPVLVRRGAHVQAFTRIVGPCVIGVESQVGGDKIAGCSIGDVCKVHGEVSTSVFLGHANKGHDGFVGHSYLGRWVNLGAGTITSNLKNTYGPVHLWTPSGVRDTGMQFLGTLFGDHAKVGIGMRLTTGCVLGTGANVFGHEMPPKVVAPFAWGESGEFETYRVDKFLLAVERMMARRQVELGDSMRAQLTRAHESRWSVEP